MTNNKTERESMKLRSSLMRRVISIDDDLRALINLMADHGLTWEFVYETIYEKVIDFDEVIGKMVDEDEI